MIRVGAYALAAAFVFLGALSYLLAASFILQGPRARADLQRFQHDRVEQPAVVGSAERSGPTEPFRISIREPAGVPKLVEIDPYGYAGTLKPGEAVTLRYWRGRVAEVLTPEGVIQTPDDPRVIAEDSNTPSILRSVAVGVGYSLLATAIVVAARRWSAPLFRR